MSIDLRPELAWPAAGAGRSGERARPDDRPPTDPARLRFALLGEGLSTGLGFAALGVALYAQGPLLTAGLGFGATGFLCGMVNAGLRLRVQGRPAARAAPLSGDDLGGRLRATLAQARRERLAQRNGSATGRRPALATAANVARALPAAPGADAAAVTPAAPAPDPPRPSQVPALAAKRPPRFASSAFGV